MPKLIIDNHPIEVPPGTKVIEAAERLGIMIPRFCYHPALGSVGACRVCAVKFLEGPVKGVQMSCMTDAADGMVVSTPDEEAVDFRRHVIEWLMLNHPHDCPVCDEGGHCLLQDMTVSGGHGLRRYQGKKRTYRDQQLGPLIQHEMNRCIQCYRCSRYYQEFSGYRDLGAMQIARHVYFGRFRDGTLESPFSGNLIDICPTGVFTDKPSRYQGRRWDYERTPSVCIHCSLGCSTIVNVRYRRVIRQEARLQPAVNGYFICDRGRYGFPYNDRAERPRTWRSNGKEGIRSDILAAVAQKLQDIARASGPQSVACLGSMRSSVETLALLKHLCRANGWTRPVFFPERSLAARVTAAVSGLQPDLALSLSEIEQADFAAVIGADPLNEAPMLALALRQAVRRGAEVVVIDPRPVRLPFGFQHLPSPAAAVPLYLGRLVRQAVARSAAAGEQAQHFYDTLPQEDLPLQSLLDPAVAPLRQSRRPAVVCGTEAVMDTVPSLAAGCARLLYATGKEGGLFYTLPGPNAFGAALLSEKAGALEAVLEGIETGAVKALMVVEADPLRRFSDRPRLESALKMLELLVVLDYLDSETARQADCFAPTTTVYDGGGIFVNQEGRAQAAAPAYRGGIPLQQESKGGHPPRVFQEEIPGGRLDPAWRTLANIADLLRGAGGLEPANRLRTAMAEYLPALGIGHVPDEGLRLLPEEPDFDFSGLHMPAESSPAQREGGDLDLLLVEWTFGTEELSAASPPLKALGTPPQACLQTATAQAAGLSDGDTIAIQTKSGNLTVRLRLEDAMAPGTLILPRHPELSWQIFNAGQRRIAMDRIRKVT